MNGLSRHPLRVAERFIWFAGVVLFALLDYFIHFAFRPARSTPIARARWLQRHARRALNIFKLKPQTIGPVPTRGLLVSNHLSYVDVLVISAITPAVFVSKADVKSWPVFGWLAQLAGTLFVDRDRRTQVARMNEEIEGALRSGALVVLFPEGTSSNGKGVLPFKSALLEPAARRTQPLAIGCLGYALDDGDAGEEVCYWGDDTFFPHLLNLLGKRTLRVAVRFAAVAPDGTDRKQLALRLREEILKLKSECVP
jgi:1-acyl-sn-glycerol-3-phosphate acyltransferase